MKKTASAFRLLTETNVTDVTCLTSVFGMRTGVSTKLWPSSITYKYMGIKRFALAIFNLLFKR